MSTLPLSKVADASGIYNPMRNIGGAVGLALINSSLDWLTAMHVTQINPVDDTAKLDIYRTA